MASTLDEISSCPVKNRAFWSDHARFYLTHYLEHRRDGLRALVSAAAGSREQFRLCMRYRREQRYLTP